MVHNTNKLNIDKNLSIHDLNGLYAVSHARATMHQKEIRTQNHVEQFVEAAKMAIRSEKSLCPGRLLVPATKNNVIKSDNEGGKVTVFYIMQNLVECILSL